MALTPEEQAELAALQKDPSLQSAPAPQAAAPSGKLSPDEQAELARLQSDPSVVPPEPSMARKALGYAGRALDYTSGLGRTAVAAGGPIGIMSQMIKGGTPAPNEIGTMADIKAALKGQAPTTAQYMDRMGVPEGGHLSDILPIYSDKGSSWWKPEKGGMLDPTPRGTAGFVGDVAMDPATWLTLGASSAAKAAAKVGATDAEKLLAAQLAKAAAIANPIGSAMEAGGEMLHARGLKNADQLAKEFGKETLPSKVLWDNGVWGTANSVNKQASNLSDQLLAGRNGILQQATDAGAKTDVNAALDPVRQKLIDFLNSKNTVKMDAAEAMKKNMVDPYAALAAQPAQAERTLTEQIPETILGPNGTPVPHIDPATGSPVMKTQSRVIPGVPEVEAPNPLQMSDQKSSVYNKIGDGNWKDIARTPEGKQLLKSYGFGLKQETENSVGRTLGDNAKQSLAQTNDQLGSLLTTQGTLQKEANKETTRNAITPIDAMLFGLGHPHIEALKKGADISKTMLFNTGAGMGLNKIGTTLPVWSKLMNNGSTNPPQQ